MKLLLLFLCSVQGIAYKNKNPPEHFLFLGNSFTFVNDLPKTFQGLAKAGGYNIEAYFCGIGAASFQSLSQDLRVPLYINMFKWKSIIIQEQSMFLSQSQSTYMKTSIPYAVKLYNMFKNHTATVLLYETWGYQNGNPSFVTGLDDNYYKMQTRLWSGYNYTLETLKNIQWSPIHISPVGQAWAVAQAQPRFKNKMWQQDGMHPKPCGTYLAAAVFYTKIFNKSPVGIKFLIKGVTAADAKILQLIAEKIVL